MRIEQRTIYIADDGREFNDERACRAYERTSDVENFLAHEADIYWREAEPTQVAGEMTLAFVCIRREDAREIERELSRVAGFLGGFLDDSAQEGVEEMLDTVQTLRERLNPST